MVRSRDGTAKCDDQRFFGLCEGYGRNIDHAVVSVLIRLHLGLGVSAMDHQFHCGVDTFTSLPLQTTGECFYG
jgi:hypothetical protein